MNLHQSPPIQGGDYFTLTINYVSKTLNIIIQSP